MAMVRLALLLALLSSSSRVQTRFVSDEADAVLAVLAKRAAQQTITDADWNRVFTSEGYVRLKKREHSMQREFEDDAFKSFVMSDELLARREALAKTLEEWRQADLTAAANRALANSFVFEVDTDPAIFKYLEPQPRAAFEQTMSHEMHHVGYGTACPPAGVELGDMRWLGAFGEGFATLAAAGGPQNDPQKNGEKGTLQEAWRGEMAKYDENFAKLQSFFLDVTSGKLKGDEASKRAFEFFGLLGPWYSVGYKMAVTIEQAFGRDAVIAAFCDQRTLMSTYNRAVDKTGAKLPKWDARLATLPSSATRAH
jgi:hypothetical protein